MTLSVLLFTLFVTVSLSLPAAWASNHWGNEEETYESFIHFTGAMGSLYKHIMEPDSPTAQIASIFFWVFAGWLIAKHIVLWVFGLESIVEFVGAFLRIAFVGILAEFYIPITSALLQFSEHVPGAIQQIEMGTTDIFAPLSFIKMVLTNLTFSENWWLVWTGQGMLMVFVSQVLIWTLSLVAYLSVTWSIWGYALAKLIGWLFIPFLLIERLEFLFDGWLRFFFGFLIYGMIARLNCLMVAMLISSYFNFPYTTATVNTVTTIEGTTFTQLFGLLALSLIALLAFFSTGRFAMALAGGVGGFGGALGRSAMGLARMATIKM